MALPQAGVELVANGLSGFVSDMGKANNAVGDFGKQGTSAGSAFDKGFGDVVTGALRKVGELGVEALLKAGQAVVGFVGDSIKKAGDFQQGMLEFQAVAGKDVDTSGLEKFHDLFISLGKELPVSTSEVQQAAIEMVKGGIDPATVAAGGLRQNIQFAAAAMGGDLVGAANVSAKILGGWADANATAQQKADFLTHATDQLTKAANASSVDVHELSLGIFNAQGIAKTAGVSFDDLTTTLAALSPRFASSSEAGNSLKNVIARLQPTTAPAAAAMESLGLWTKDTGSAFYDAAGNFVGFQKAGQLLQDSLQGLTKEQQTFLLQQIFGNDAMNAAAGLAELGAAGYQNMADALDKANGVQANAALKQQGFNTALENAKGSVEALQITLGEKLLPILTDLLNNVVAPAINAFTDWADSIFSAEDPLQELVNQIDTFSPILGTVVAAIADFITTGGDMGVVLDDIREGFGPGLAGPIEAIASFLGDNLKPILVGVALAITAAVVPAIVSATTAFVAAAAPIVALVAAGALLYKAWDSDFLGIRTTVTEWWTDTLQPAFTQVQEWLSKNIPAAVQTLVGFWNNYLQPALEAAYLVIRDYLIPFFSALFRVEFAIASKVVEALAGLWQKVLQPALEAAGTYIDKTLSPVFHEIGDWLDRTFGPVLQDIKDWLGDVTGGFEGVTGAVKGAIKWLSDLADTISNLKLPDWLTPGSPTPLEIGIRGIGDALRESAVPGVNALFDALQNVLPMISQIADASEQLGKVGEQVANALSTGFAATATIERQQAKNLADLQKLSGAMQQQASFQLKTAQDLAAQMTDPKQAAEFFAMRSKQIFELAQLQDKVSAETDTNAQARLAEQLALIQQAQQQEQKAFQAKAGSKSASDSLIDAIRQLFAAGFPVNDTGVGADLMALLAQLEGYKPPVSPVQQYPGPTAGPTYNYNYSMPVTTNMTPAAIQQSWAIMGAALP